VNISKTKEFATYALPSTSSPVAGPAQAWQRPNKRCVKKKQLMAVPSILIFLDVKVGDLV